MTERQIIFTALLIGMAIYAPIGIYVFDNTLATMLERDYFMISGAAIALYAYRGLVSTAEKPTEG